jgi:phosphoglycerate dehydrogenase-like enzyme
MYDPSHARGVRVASSSGGNAEPISLSVLTGLLSIARGMTHWQAAQRNHEWAPLQSPNLPRDVTGQTAVVVGMGPIGMEIGRLLQAVGLRTIGIRRSVAPAAHFDEVRSFDDLDEVLPRCDWLILACPLTDTTRNLIDGRRLAMLPAGAGMVNVARGECVDEPALIDALERKHLVGAYLDVFAVEPLPDASPLWDMPNVIVTPHNCSASAGNFERGVEIFLRNLEHYLRDEPLENEPRAKAAEGR